MLSSEALGKSVKGVKGLLPSQCSTRLEVQPPRPVPGHGGGENWPFQIKGAIRVSLQRLPHHQLWTDAKVAASEYHGRKLFRNAGFRVPDSGGLAWV